MKQYRYPAEIFTAEGYRQAVELVKMGHAERTAVAREAFGAKLAHPGILLLVIPAGIDRDRCGYYCDQAVRYVEAYDVIEDAVLGRLDLAIAEV